MTRARGFTLIELVVVICVVALVFGVALDRLERYAELGERAAVEQNVAVINTALTLKFAALVTAGQAEAIGAEVGANPVKLLARAPENYVGELRAPPAASLEKRSWYFDPGTGELVYLPGRARFLGFSSPGQQSLRFRVALTEGHSEPDQPRVLQQPYLRTQTPYRWNIE